MKIRKGDTVHVLTGKDRGKTGVVECVLPKRDQVVVEGINKRIKHVKPQRSSSKGQRIEISAPMHISNVAVVDPQTKKPTRVGIDRSDGRVRVTKKSGTKL